MSGTTEGAYKAWETKRGGGGFPTGKTSDEVRKPISNAIQNRQIAEIDGGRIVVDKSEEDYAPFVRTFSQPSPKPEGIKGSAFLAPTPKRFERFLKQNNFKQVSVNVFKNSMFEIHTRPWKFMGKPVTLLDVRRL
jgi:hypothetical protein